MSANDPYPPTPTAAATLAKADLGHLPPNRTAVVATADLRGRLPSATRATGGILYDVQIMAHRNAVMKEMKMNNNMTRLGLAVVAAFYVVVGGLWAADYFPLQKFYAQGEIKESIVEKIGYPAAYDTEEYKAALANQRAYAVKRPRFADTKRKIALYRSLLLWGTVGFGVGGGVLLVTPRGRKGHLPIG